LTIFYDLTKLSFKKAVALPKPQQTGKFAKDSEAINLNQTIKTSDLISWSLQISRGMEFLASKKVIESRLKLFKNANDNLFLTSPINRSCTVI
jgi:hypothetical protein